MPKVENLPRLEVQKSRAKTFLVTLKDADGNAEDITGATVLFTVKNDYGGAQLFQKTLTGGETGADFPNGVVAIAVVASDTSGVSITAGDPALDHVFDLKVTLSSVPYATIFDHSRTGIFRIWQSIG